MIREDHVRAIRDRDARDVHADALEHLEFGEQTLEADHRAAADEERGARLQHAAGHDAQRQFTLAHHQRVAGVVAAAEAGDDVVVRGEQIDDAALALVAPLHAENDVGLVRHSPRNSRSLVSPMGCGRMPLNVVNTNSLKRALGQPKSFRENRPGSLGSNDSCKRWSPGSLASN